MGAIRRIVSLAGTVGGDTAAIGAIILAGGRATRVGGAAKPLFEVGGTTLLAHAVAAAHSIGCISITIVGPEPHSDAADTSAPSSESATPVWVREDPPFGGPVSAIVAALRSSGEQAKPSTAWTLLLASDLPRAEAGVAVLAAGMADLPVEADGVCLSDASSKLQWLTGIYRTSALRRAASSVPHAGHGASMRALLADLVIAGIDAPPQITADVDTWEDLDDARQLYTAREMEQK